MHLPPNFLPHPPQLYKCDKCDSTRTKEQGGTTFTLCDKCWDEVYPRKTMVSMSEPEGCEDGEEDSSGFLQQDHALAVAIGKTMDLEQTDTGYAASLHVPATARLIRAHVDRELAQLRRRLEKDFGEFRRDSQRLDYIEEFCVLYRRDSEETDFKLAFDRMSQRGALREAIDLMSGPTPLSSDENPPENSPSAGIKNGD